MTEITEQNNSGTMSASNVNNILVSCSLNSYPLGGSVSGNLGGLIVTSPLVLANGSDQLQVPFTGPSTISFTFNQKVPYLQSYSVVVASQPRLAGLLQLTCTVTANGSGTMVVGGVSNVYVQCL